MQAPSFHLNENDAARQFDFISPVVLVPLVLACLAWGSAHAELVTDGGFEDGGLDYWGIAYTSSGSCLQAENVMPHSGTTAITFFAQGGRKTAYPKTWSPQLAPATP